jgi:hypothetical protein
MILDAQAALVGQAVVEKREVARAVSRRDRRARVVERRVEELTQPFSDWQRIDVGARPLVFGADPFFHVGTRGILERAKRVGNRNTVQDIDAIVARRRWNVGADRRTHRARLPKGRAGGEEGTGRNPAEHESATRRTSLVNELHRVSSSTARAPFWRYRRIGPSDQDHWPADGISAGVSRWAARRSTISGKPAGRKSATSRGVRMTCGARCCPVYRRSGEGAKQPIPSITDSARTSRDIRVVPISDIAFVVLNCERGRQPGRGKRRPTQGRPRELSGLGRYKLAALRRRGDHRRGPQGRRPSFFMQLLYTASRFFIAAWSGTCWRACVMHVSMAEYLPVPMPISLWAHAPDTEPNAPATSNAKVTFLRMLISLFDPKCPGGVHDTDGGPLGNFTLQ